MFLLTNNLFAGIKSSQDNINIIGPKEGFTPQIGTLVSMLNWMREEILLPIKCGEIQPDILIKDGDDFSNLENDSKVKRAIKHIIESK